MSLEQDQIKIVQQVLNETQPPFYFGAIDGIWGPETQSAYTGYLLSLNVSHNESLLAPQNIYALPEALRAVVESGFVACETDDSDEDPEGGEDQNPEGDDSDEGQEGDDAGNGEDPAASIPDPVAQPVPAPKPQAAKPAPIVVDPATTPVKAIPKVQR